MKAEWFICMVFFLAVCVLLVVVAYQLGRSSAINEIYNFMVAQGYNMTAGA